MSRWSEHSILDAVEKWFDATHPSRMLRQVRVEDRRLDAVVVSHSGHRDAIEAKTTRSDYRSETAAKRSAAERFAHRCWYAAPEGVIDRTTLPPSWGLIVVSEAGCALHHAASTPNRPDDALGDRVASTLLWRAAAAESRERVPGDPVALSAEIDKLTGIIATRDATVARERARAVSAREQVLAALGEQVCAQCRYPIRYAAVGEWRHVDRAQDPPCTLVRAERVRLEREAATGARYSLQHPGPVLPLQLSMDR